MNSSDYKQLDLWKASIAMVKDVYNISKKFPKEEQYGLVSQIRRAAVSVPSNIAEGHGRNSEKDFIRFLLIANGSICEVETQCILSVELEYLQSEEIESILTSCKTIKKMAKGLIQYLERRSNQQQ